MEKIKNNAYMSKWKLIVSASLILAMWPMIALAETVVRTGGSVSVGVNQVVENDFYGAAGSLTQSGEVKEDAYMVAGSVTVNGEVGVDLTALGGTVQIHSPVGDDVRVVGGEVVIASEVGGDVFVLGGTLKVLSSATVDGNVYFYGGDAEIEGVVTGQVMGRAESFSVNSQVGGMDVVAVRVDLGDRANVGGDVAYSAVSELSRAPGATVAGEVVRGAERPVEEGGGNTFPLVFVFIWLFTSLCFFLLFRPTIETILHTAKKDTLKVGLFGLVAAFVGPLIGIVLLATVLGVWLGILKILVTALLFILTMMLLPIILGGYLISFWKPHRKLDIWSVLAGMVVVVVFAVIPVLGGIAIFAAYVVTLGSILHLLYQKTRGII